MTVISCTCDRVMADVIHETGHGILLYPIRHRCIRNQPTYDMCLSDITSHIS